MISASDLKASFVYFLIQRLLDVIDVNSKLELAKERTKKNNDFY